MIRITAGLPDPAYPTEMTKGWLVLTLGLAGCGMADSGGSVSIGVDFLGYAPTLSTATAELTVDAGSLHLTRVGTSGASPSQPESFPSFEASPGQTVVLRAVARDQAGHEVAVATGSFQVEADWAYHVSFQAGGVNPDTRGFCHRPPSVTPLTGFAGDSLYLWVSALPNGAVC